LVPVSNVDEGSLFRMLWGGDLQELTILGASMEVKDLPPSKSGQEVSTLCVQFHVSRNIWYFGWKVLCPIYLLLLLTMFVFVLEVEACADRLSLIITLFLASFAMLYVVEQHLPKTNFLTVIDKVVSLSTVVLVCAAGAVCLIYLMRPSWGPELANQCNTGVVCALSCSYVGGNICIFAPAWRRMRQQVRALSAGKDGHSSSTAIRPSSGVSHYRYVPLAAMPRS